MSLNFRSSSTSSLGFGLALTLSLALAPMACLDAHIISYTDSGAGMGGQGEGGMTGTGGDAVNGTGGGTGVGGAMGTGGMRGVGGRTGSGGRQGTGGVGTGGPAATGTGGLGTGGTGTGGSGVGGAMDAGVDASDGGTHAVAPDMAGQLVITEIMADTVGPSDELGEWFELYNPSSSQTYDLFGCALFDSNTGVGNTDFVMSHVLVAPGIYVTLARFGTTAGGFMPTYNYHTTLTDAGILDVDKDVKFGNDGDRVGITCGNTQIDVVDFQSTPWLAPVGTNPLPMVPHGRSYNLDPAHLNSLDNDRPENWCTGTAVYPPPAGPDHGTPNQPNTACGCVLNTCPWM